MRSFILAFLVLVSGAVYGQDIQCVKGEIQNQFFGINQAKVVLLVDGHESVEASSSWGGRFELYFAFEEGKTYQLKCQAPQHVDKIIRIKPPKKEGVWNVSNVRLRTGKDYVSPGGWVIRDFEAYDQRSEVR